MRQRLLATRLDLPSPILAELAYGINHAETANPTIDEMVARDNELIRGVQPQGPYKLLGYTIGPRVAFEVANQQEPPREHVDQVILQAPGKPPVEAH
ncbi:thioesterase domain-containing protein, partial [Streptomyces sp. SP17BM10]|uniref:thioesterase domain-containing protein n=1 Tax=Streptomyces sp. SP17BM10 TaxID=3002530 RepID=UPI002E765EC8